MKIATFNINNVNKRLVNLLDWLRTFRADVVCLQELKAADAEFPKAAFEKEGYGAVWRGEKSWNGVAILARDCEPIVTRTELPGDPADTQSRYIEAAVNGVLITSLYAPNGNPQPGPKFKYKLAWMERLATHTAELYAVGIPVVLAGDYNVVPTDRDIYTTKSYAKDALLQPETRVLFRCILDQGWVDAIRILHPEAPMYTFWDYMRNRWSRDAGLRVDHLLLSAAAATRLMDAGVNREIRANPGASDHAPAWIVLRDDDEARRTTPRITRNLRKRTHPLRDRLSVDLCWWSTVILSHIGPTMHYPKLSCGAAEDLPVLSLVSRISCCGSIGRSSRAQCSSLGTHWSRLLIATSNFLRIRADASSTTICSSNSISCRSS